jgi:hypothetical protein
VGFGGTGVRGGFLAVCLARSAGFFLTEADAALVRAPLVALLGVVGVAAARSGAPAPGFVRALDDFGERGARGFFGAAAFSADFSGTGGLAGTLAVGSAESSLGGEEGAVTQPT